MKTSELIRRMQAEGCTFVRHGGRHDIWASRNGEKIEVPRHRSEVKPGTAQMIMKIAKGER